MKMTAAIAEGGSPLQFGFVPHGTIAALCDLGNWKMRADAIETLHRLVLDLPNGVDILPTLPEFVGFLNKLLADPNFKISLTTLQIWDALVAKVGPDARPVVPFVVPTLVKKLGDAKIVVRQANMRVLNTLYHTMPGATMNALVNNLAGTVGSTAGARGAATATPARVKEDALNVIIRAMLDDEPFPPEDVDPAAVVARLVRTAQEQTEGKDEGEAGDMMRARATAVEALAVVASRLGKEEAWRLIDCVGGGNAPEGSGCSADLRWELTARFEDSRLATVSADGLIEHGPAAGAVLARPRSEELRTSLDSPKSVDGSPLRRRSLDLHYSPRPSPLKGKAGEESGNGSGADGQVISAGGHGPHQPPTQAGKAGTGNLRRRSFDGMRKSMEREKMHSEGEGTPGSAGGRSESSNGVKDEAISALGERHTVPSPPPARQTARRREPVGRRLITNGNGHGEDDENVVPEAGSAGSLLKRRMNRSPPSLQVSNPTGENGTNGENIIVLGYGSANDGHSNRTPQPPSTEDPSMNEVGDEDPAGLSMGSAPTPRSGSSLLGRRAAAANAQRQVKSNGQVPTPTTPKSNAPMWLSNDTPGNGTPAGTPGDAPFDPFAPIPRVAHSPPIGARRMSRKSNSMDSLRVGDLRYGLNQVSSESSTSSTSTPVDNGGGLTVRTGGEASTSASYTPGADSPKDGSFRSRSNIGGKLTALKRRQESRRAVSANLMSTARLGSRVSSAPDGGGVSSGYPTSSTPLGHSYLTGRSGGDGDDDVLDLGLGGPGPARGCAVAGRRAGMSVGVVGNGSQRRHPPGPLDVSMSGDFNGGNGYSTPTPDGGRGIGSGTFAPGGVSTPSGFARPRRDVSSDHGEGFATPRGIGSRTGSRGLEDSNANPLGEFTTEELQPVSNPEAVLRKAVADLVTASVAKHKELDWQAQHQGLLSMRRLVVHHGGIVLPQLHTTVLAMIPAIDSLRSSIAKVAMSLVKEMGQFLDQKSLDSELDYLIPVLAKKSGENNWLGSDADQAIREFVFTATDVRILSSLIGPAKHKSPAVRMRVACHIECCCANATTRTFTGAVANRDLLEKTFSTVVGLLEEGSADTRTMAKRTLCHLHRHLTANQAPGERCGDFERLLKRLPNEAKIKAVRTVVEKGPPPLPAVKNGGAGVRGGIGTPRSLSTTPRARSGAGSANGGIRGYADDLLSQHKFGSSNGNGSEGGFQGRRTMSVPKDAQFGAAFNGDDGASPLGLSNGVMTDRSSQGLGHASSLLGSRSGASTSRGSSGGGIAGLKQRLAASRGAAKAGTSDDGAGGGSDLETVMGPVFNKLQAKDWKERSDGIAEMQAIVQAAAPGSFTESATVATFDALVPRLGDGNSKVSVQAFNTLSVMLPSLGDDSAPVLSTLVPALAGGIGSTNDKVKSAAMEAGDRLLESVSAPLLVPHIAHCVSHGMAGAKPVLLNKLAGLVEAVHPTRPQMVTKYVLPASVTALMNESRGEVRAANVKLLTALANCLGRDELMGQAAAISTAAASKVEDTLFSFSSK